MPDNAALITRFYEAFAVRDAATMGACYADDVRFSDPVFPELRGDRARGMWAMLCAQGKDLEIVFSDVVADAHTGQAHWDATYTFSPTGRRVHNRIDARFQIVDGRIVDHVDTFDLDAWLRMGIGGWAPWLGPLMRFGLRRGAARGLDQYLKRHP